VAIGSVSASLDKSVMLISTYGFYYVDKYTGKVTKHDIVLDKEVEI